MRRVLLISLRDPGDPIREHERQCFLDRAGLASNELTVFGMAEGVPSRDQLQSYDAVLFGGSGAYSVLDGTDWIRRGLDTLTAVVDLRVPAWASCFGFQGLALALGGTVIRDDEHQEMGSTELELTPAGLADPVLSVLPRRFWAQEGHHDRVSRLPSGVTLLARGDFVEEQAFKVDGAPFWASQFHPELTVGETLYRFRHYQHHYADASEADAIAERLAAGVDSPEMARVLPALLGTG